jgi:RecJ-like exonuclease
MKKHLSSLALIALTLSALPLRAEDKPAAAPAAPPAPPAGDKIFAAKDLEALRAVKGQTVKVEGTILKQGESKTGTVRYLNFTDKYQESISLVFMVSKGGGDFTKEKLTNYVGKKVQVTGAVGEYNNNLQIEVASFDQIKLVP